MEDIPRFRIILTAVLSVALIAGIGLTVARMPRQNGGLVIVQPTPVAATAAQKDIKVYVSGAVARGGVYTMQDGQRIEDALAAAGGASANADLSRLNLAGKVRDEMQVNVPLLSEGVAQVSPAGDSRIDINTAAAAVLDTLPDIGPATAQKIIIYREKNGPFKRIEELAELKLVGQSTYTKIKDLITTR